MALLAEYLPKPMGELGRNQTSTIVKPSGDASIAAAIPEDGREKLSVVPQRKVVGCTALKWLEFLQPGYPKVCRSATAFSTMMAIPKKKYCVEIVKKGGRIISVTPA